MKSEKVRWGVLGAAKIAINQVIPAMQQGEWSEVVAIASRDLEKAQAAATELGIPKAYGSYEELLADPDVEAVYNPLPQPLARSLVHKSCGGGETCVVREAH